MRILTQPDGSFMFVFTSEEKKLGIDIISMLRPITAEDKMQQRKAIHDITYAGVEPPNNVQQIVLIK